MTTTPLLGLSPESSLSVEHVCDLSVDLHAPSPIGTPMGQRLTYIAKGGVVSGQVSGQLLAGGGDWVVVGTDGISRMDIRQTIRTHDGALIHFAALGVVRLPHDGRERVGRGERIPFREAYIRSTPRLETGDERYRHLNGQVFVSVGELSAGHIDHRVYRVL